MPICSDYSHSSKKTLSEKRSKQTMISRFLDYIATERQYSDLTVKAYGDDLQAFADFLKVDAAELDIRRVTTDDVQAWMISMMDSGQSARSVKRRLSALRSYVRFCLKVGLVEHDVTQKIIAPKMKKTLPVFYKENEMKAEHEIIRHADDFPSKRNGLIIEMLYQTGMRRAEIAGLQDADFDLSQQQVRIFGKRRKERIVPFGNPLRDMITDYLQMRSEQLGGLKPETFFCRENGQPLSVDDIYNIVRRMMSEVSTLKKQSPHVLRHTFATTMLNNGADINTIKTLMGHASLAATEIYTHTTFDQVRQAYHNAHPRERKQ